jgi:hypothetical protein
MLLDLEKNHPLEVKGALDMARKIIKLPLELKLSDKTKDNVRNDIKEDFKEFEVKFIKRHLIDE